MSTFCGGSETINDLCSAVTRTENCVKDSLLKIKIVAYQQRNKIECFPKVFCV